MGMVYRPKYRNAVGELVESSVYWIQFYVNGKRVRVNTKSTKESVALKELKRREGDTAHGLPFIPKVNQKTVAEILADVLTDYENRKLDSIKHAERRINKHLLPYFGNWNAASVNDDQVRDYRKRRMKAGASVASINRELSLLKRGYTLNRRAVTIRPDIPIPKEKNARKGFFERQQFEAVRAALPDYLQPLLTVAYVTGWRVKSELLALEWRHVDFNARTLRLDPGMAKNDEAREFPFTDELAEALEAQRAATDDATRLRCPYVFHRKGVRVRYWRRPWLQALLSVGLASRPLDENGQPKKTGKIIAHVMPHDFRRTAIRNLARAGVSEAIAMKLCGHETRSVFDRYNIVTGDDLRAAAAKLNAAATVSATVAAVSAIPGGR